jgi:oligoendopeptidase F
VVENLIETTKAGTEPLRRYHRLRKRVLGLDSYHTYDARFRWSNTIGSIRTSRCSTGCRVGGAAGPSTAAAARRALRRLDRRLRESGKRSGAYSAPVYGVHPYMLLNYNDTLDAVFTLAHEMGHSMHTLLSNAHQPFVYSAYTIFVAEVPSTLSEALFLEFMLEARHRSRERIVLLQHAIDGIVGTFYTQVLFADYELQAHRLVETGQPVTADTLGDIYFNLLQAYYGDALDYDELSRVTWARIPHFYSTPYYVYQYATCFASSAQLMHQLTSGPSAIAPRRSIAI